MNVEQRLAALLLRDPMFALTVLLGQRGMRTDEERAVIRCFVDHARRAPDKIKFGVEATDKTIALTLTCPSTE